MENLIGSSSSDNGSQQTFKDEQVENKLSKGRNFLSDAFFSYNEINARALQPFNLLFKNHPSPMLVYEFNSLRFVAVNDAAIEQYGYSADEFLCMTVMDIRPESEIERLRTDLKKGRPLLHHSGLWLHRKKNGLLMDVDVTSQKIENENETYILVTVRDVTETLRAERQLRQLNRLYSILSDVNQAIVRERDMPELFNQICRLTIKKEVSSLTWLSLSADGNGNDLLVAACEAETPPLLKKARVKLGRPAADCSPFFSAYHSDQPYINNEIAADASTGRLPAELCVKGIHACGVFPLLIKGQVRGTLNLFSRQAGNFNRQEIELLQEMSSDIAFAIEHDEQEQHRRAAELDLQRKTAELDRYFNSNLDMLCIGDTKGYFRRLNPEWEKELGYAPGEMEGRRFIDFVHPDDVEETLKAHEELAGDSTVRSFTNRFQGKDGVYRWIEWRSIPIDNLIYASARDVTERVHAIESLNRSRQQIASFVKLFPGPAFIKDHQRRIVFASEVYDRYFDTPVSGWVGRTMQEIVPEEIATLMDEKDDLVLSTNEPCSFEVFIPAPHKQWLLTTLFPVPDSDGEMGVAGFSLDVTAVKKSESEIQTLYDLSVKLRSVQTREEIIAVLCKLVREAMDADSGQVVLPDDDHNCFYIANVDGMITNNIGSRFPIDQGVSSWVWKTGQTYVSEDYASDPHHTDLLDTHDIIGPSIFTPLRSEEDMMGVLFVARIHSPRAELFTPEDMRLFRAIGEMAGIAIRRVDLYNDALRRLNHVQALRNIDLAITGNLDLNLTLDMLLKEVKKELRVDAAGVLLLDESTETLNYAAGHGFNTNLIEKTNLHLGEGLPGEAALQRVIKYSHHLQDEAGFIRQEMRKAEGFEVYFSAPMISKGKVLGILEIFHRSPHPAVEEWHDLLIAMAGRAAIAVDNARLISDLQQSNQVLRQAYDATILGWSRAMDLRDEDTEGHTQRVTEMTINLARAMGISEEELIHVRRGALLHDMGKLGVPDNILRKPGPLTDEEWAVMRCHPLYTYDMLSPIEFLRPALDIPFFHHEKWDGSGYPSGLKGEDIPLAARIFAVIDVYDALTSDRPYRSAWPIDRALEHIRNGSGSHFDPHVVEMFMRMMAGG